MKKNIKKILIIGILIQSIILGILFIYNHYTTIVLRNIAEKQIEKRYQTEITYKETKYTLLGKEYIFIIDNISDIEITGKYVFSVNINPLGKYLFDFIPKVEVSENYKAEVVDYLLDKYVNKDHMIDVSDMDVFEAAEIIKKAYVNIKDEAEEKYNIYLPDDFVIKVKNVDVVEEMVVGILIRSSQIRYHLEEMGVTYK